jgi:NADPH:quinone reductase-like Zn-dependent oxidoreductase
MKSNSMSGAETMENTNGTIPAFSGKMKAVRIHEYGGVEKLIYESVDIPQVGPDEVLIRVYAAGVNPVDWKIREGHMKDNAQLKLPLILGWDIAGTVIRTGSLVTHYDAGMMVFARLDTARNGGYAEYAIAKADEMAIAPHIPLHIAAGIPLAAQTAWMGLFEIGNLLPKQKVLIHGASGGVGMFAVQLAKIAGAHVIGTTSEINVPIVKSLGADEVINYNKEDFSSKLRDIDFVFDLIGGQTQENSWKVLRKGGTLVSTVGVDIDKAALHGMIGKQFMVTSNGARLAEIAGLINKDMLRVVIDREFSLEDVKKAHELSQSGKTRGKIILRIHDNLTHIE